MKPSHDRAMNPSPEKPSREAHLERLVHQTLRELPARRAPRALEGRVLAELARRAALPWWRKSFAHWPLAARALFVVAALFVAKLAVSGAIWISSGLDVTQYRTIFATEFAWWESARTVVHAIGSFLDILTRNIPPLWLYGGIAFCAAAYAAIFGLGAAAYRALRTADA